MSSSTFPRASAAPTPKLVPLLEQPLVGAPSGQLLAHVFDTQTGRYTGRRFTYAFDARGSAIADFILTSDAQGISLPAQPGDVGLAFPFTTIEDAGLLPNGLVGVINDNNDPTRVGRHVGTGAPDGSEFIVLRLPEPVLPAKR